MSTPDIDLAIEQALEHHLSSRLLEAEAAYRQVLALDPDESEAWHGLALLAHQSGQTEMAIDLLQRALALDPMEAEYYSTFSVVLEAAGRFEEAAGAARQAIALQGDHPQAHNNLAAALEALGRLDEAIAEYAIQLQLTPDLPEAHHNLGNALHARGDHAGAIASYQRAIDSRGDFAQAWCHLGLAFKDAGYLVESVQAYRRAIALGDTVAESYCGLADTLAMQGQSAAALEAYRAALAHDPAYQSASDGQLYMLHFSPDHDGPAILREHAAWAVGMAKRRLPSPPPTLRTGRLRVGYVSGDFCQHVVGRNLEPMLQYRQRDAFEIFCYADNRASDHHTARLRSLVDHWRPIHGLSDAQVFERIRADGIDILVDLSHHMARNRLGVFAMKPAPVQATHLGCAATTGLAAIDFRITDPYLDPLGQTEGFGVERLIRLPNCYWCYTSPTDAPIVALPARARGQITFGSLNSMYKVNAQTIALWCDVLRAVPDSKMRLHGHLPGDGSTTSQGYMLEQFALHGIERERIQLVGRAPMAQFIHEYDAIDIGLDPLPYTGHMTSLDSFWMGVPVVTLAGQTPVSRGGVSIAMNLGLSTLIAQSAAEYVAIAIKLASDLPSLADLRQSLRQRLVQSPLCDGPAYARAMDAALRGMAGSGQGSPAIG